MDYSQLQILCYRFTKNGKSMSYMVDDLTNRIDLKIVMPNFIGTHEKLTYAQAIEVAHNLVDRYVNQ
jgi:hypothetical protein